VVNRWSQHARVGPGRARSRSVSPGGCRGSHCRRPAPAPAASGTSPAGSGKTPITPPMPRPGRRGGPGERTAGDRPYGSGRMTWRRRATPDVPPLWTRPRREMAAHPRQRRRAVPGQRPAVGAGPGPRGRARLALRPRRGPGPAGRSAWRPPPRHPGLSQLTTVDWLDDVHRLFAKETIERLERHAVERYQIHDVVTDPAVLERVEPNRTLLRAVHGGRWRAGRWRRRGDQQRGRCLDRRAYPPGRDPGPAL